MSHGRTQTDTVMISFNRLLLILAPVLAALLAAGFVYADRDDEDQIDVSQLPREVSLAVRKAYAEGELTEIRRDGRGDDAVYRMLVKLEGRDNDVWLKVVADGSILEIDESMRKEDIPPAVVRALRKAFPHSEVQSLDKRSRIEVVYKVDIQDGRKRREIKITPRGRIVEVERK
jgi:hypothetical protein